VLSLGVQEILEGRQVGRLAVHFDPSQCNVVSCFCFEEWKVVVVAYWLSLGRRMAQLLDSEPNREGRTYCRNEMGQISEE
jgi:hypothetical protein